MYAYILRVHSTYSICIYNSRDITLYFIPNIYRREENPVILFVYTIIVNYNNYYIKRIINLFSTDPHFALLSDLNLLSQCDNYSLGCSYFVHTFTSAIVHTYYITCEEH